MNGLQTRVRTSNAILEQQLRLTFVGLTEAQMLSIRSHYIGQQGRFRSFFIPSSLLSGMTTPASFTPTGYGWIYAGSPQVEDIPGTQRYTVSVELVTEPPQGANINGAEFTVSITLAAGIGAGTANVNIPGAEFTVPVTLEAGGPFGDIAFIASGFDLSVGITLESGAAAGESDQYWSDYVAQVFGWDAGIQPDWWAD